MAAAGGHRLMLLTTPRARLRRLLRPGAPSPLVDRVVLVTGASSGIGEATAHAAAARGAIVLLVARRGDELERVRAAIAAAGGRAATYVCDLTDLDAVDTLVAQVQAEHGAVDYLVNNAGRSIRRSLHLSYDRFHDVERTMAINYFGPVRLTLGLLPAMRAQRFGQVVNILSWGVQLQAPKFSAYLASKTALDTWSRIAAREVYGDNVTFTNMRFGLVRTAMVAPTDDYDGLPAMSAERAGALVVRALEDRPVEWNIPIGVAGEVLGLVAPRLMDAVDAPPRPADEGLRGGGRRRASLLGGGLLGGLLRRSLLRCRLLGRRLLRSGLLGRCLLGCRLLRRGLLGGSARRRPRSSASSSPRADFAACTERWRAASRSTTSPEDLVEVGVRLISPPSIFAFTSDSTAPA